MPSRRRLLLLALATACRRQPDTPPPTTPETTAPPATTAAAVDCSNAAIEAVAKGSATWTTQGRTCLDTLGTACREGDGQACGSAANILAVGLGGVTADAPAAYAMLVEACGRELSRACFYAASMTALGLGTPRDPEATVQHLQRACDLGEADACKLLAEGRAAAEGESR